VIRGAPPMSRRLVGLIAILLAGCLLLSGCATGNLPRDSAFFPYKTTDNLHVLVSKTFANVTWAASTWRSARLISRYTWGPVSTANAGGRSGPSFLVSRFPSGSQLEASGAGKRVAGSWKALTSTHGPPILPPFMARTRRPRVVAVIPPASPPSALPGKPLLNETGKYLVQHVWDRVIQARRLSRVLIATDDKRVERAAKSFGAEVVMTSPDHPNGTSRCAEVARKNPLRPRDQHPGGRARHRSRDGRQVRGAARVLRT